MTNRNTKGQFARKTAPKKPVKKPTKAQREMERREALLTEYFCSISEQTSAILKQGEKLDQIQRDIDLLKSGSSFMQEVEQHKAHEAQAEEQGLEDGDYCDASPELLADLWKMGFEKDPGRLRPFVNWHAKRRTMITHDVLTGYEGRPFRQLPPADFLSRACVTAKKMGLVPEEPKAEPWVPKVGDWVVCDKVQKGPSPGWAKPFMDDLIGIPMKVVERERAYAVRACSFLWADEWLRPATQEEIAEAEGEWKLKKLVRGCRVETPDGRGIYLGREASAAAECHHPYWVSLDREAGVPGAPYCFNLDQLTPLT